VPIFGTALKSQNAIAYHMWWAKTGQFMTAITVVGTSCKVQHSRGKWAVREAALEAIAQRGDPSLLPKIVAALEDEMTCGGVCGALERLA
jgi:hypothetical protein